MDDARKLYADLREALRRVRRYTTPDQAHVQRAIAAAEDAAEALRDGDPRCQR